MDPTTSIPSATNASRTDSGTVTDSLPVDSFSPPSISEPEPFAVKKGPLPWNPSASRSTDDRDRPTDHGNDPRAAFTSPIEGLPSQGPILVRPCARTEKRMLASALKDAMDELDRIWNVEEEGNGGGEEYDEDDDLTVEENDSSSLSTSSPSTSCDRVRQTAALLVRAFSQDVYDPAIRALTENEELRSRTEDLTNQVESNLREIERLRRSEQRSKESIKNLLKAVDRSTEEAKDSSQAKLVEAKLRADLLQARKERDSAHHESLVAQRSLELLKEDAESLKKEKIRLQHENLRLEREARSARSHAEALSTSITTSSGESVDFYKRKARDLETHLQGMTARLAEKNQEILELRHCRDRNLSQSRLEALRACGTTTPVHKKARVTR